MGSPVHLFLWSDVTQPSPFIVGEHTMCGQRVTRLTTAGSLLSLIGSILLFVPYAVGLPSDDSYLAGYAAAILQREFRSSTRSLTVKAGVISMRADDIAGSDRERLVAVLSSIPGVMRVEVLEVEPQAIATSSEQAESPGTGPAANSTLLSVGWLPKGHLFGALLADPRWPHFSAAYTYYIDDREVKNVAAVSFGETFPLYRGNGPIAGQWEVGLQAGVFAIFDLDAESKDLINADYFVAAVAAYRQGGLSVLGRLFHQSSHLGDEFVLRNRANRVNLSYEGVDLKVSYDFPYGFRLYGGGGFLFDQEPSDLEPWLTQVGVEFRSPWTLWNPQTRLVGAVDIKNDQENDWRANVSLRAGVQFDSVQILGRSLQLLLHYFNGYSPNGQFYNRQIQYVGFGAHFHF